MVLITGGSPGGGAVSPRPRCLGLFARGFGGHSIGTVPSIAARVKG